MSKGFIEDTTLTAIAAAIRSKNGLETQYRPDEMAAAISAIESGGGGLEKIVLTGDCSNLFYHQPVLIDYVKEIKDATNISYLFYKNRTISEVPFDISLNTASASYAFYNSSVTKIKKITGIVTYAEKFFTDANLLKSIEQLPVFKNSNITTMFENCNNLQSIPPMTGSVKTSLARLFWSNYKITDLTETLKDLEISSFTNGSYDAAIFNFCDNLRKVPSSFLKQFNKYNGQANVKAGCPYKLFYECKAIDEAKEIGVCNFTSSSAVFKICDGTQRIKSLTFETNEDGTPIITSTWNDITLDISYNMGFGSKYLTFTDNLTGIDETTLIKDQESYELLKDNPNCWTQMVGYSRYNHDSAVETINSLPDVSSGGSCTIKFKGEAGSLTDGGAINTMTEEEVAVATAKGWTVTLV